MIGHQTSNIKHQTSSINHSGGAQDFEFLRAGVLHNLELFQPDQVVYAKNHASWDYIDPALPKSDEVPDGM